MTVAYYARRAAEYERVYAKPERQHDLRAIEAWLPAWFAQRQVLEIACGTGWWTPHGALDCASWLATDINDETLDDGSMHEVLKNFPTREQAIGALGPRAHDAQWHEWPHYWAITYTIDAP